MRELLARMEMSGRDYPPSHAVEALDHAARLAGRFGASQRVKLRVVVEVYSEGEAHA